MAPGDLELIRRGHALFNGMLDPETEEYRAGVERVWADEPEIVPMRAALEGNVYRGPGALDAFRDDSREAWSKLEVELQDITGDGPAYLCTCQLRGRGRQSGAEIRSELWVVIEIADGRISRLAAYLDRAPALADFGAPAG